MTDASSHSWSSRKPAGARAFVVVGCMNFGGRTPEAEARAIIDRALERGLRHFDTANAYGSGKSERILGGALAHEPEAQIATKVGMLQLRGKSEGLAPERVLTAVDESLGRLGRSSVDLLYLHAPDRLTPIDETLGAISQLLASGRVKQFGVSNFAAWEILELSGRCDALGLPRPRISQVLLNLAIRQIEIEYVRFATQYGVHTTVYNPLAGGLFARALRRDAPPPKGSRFDVQSRYRDRYWSERIFAFTDVCRTVATQAGMSLADLAYGWLAQHPGVDSILAGPATIAHLDAAIDGCGKTLTPELLDRIRVLQRAFDGTDASYAR